MTRPQTLTLTLTEPQYLEVLAAIDLRYAVLTENQDRESTRMAQTVDRAGERIKVAWQRAVDGF